MTEAMKPNHRVRDTAVDTLEAADTTAAAVMLGECFKSAPQSTRIRERVAVSWPGPVVWYIAAQQVPIRSFIRFQFSAAPREIWKTVGNEIQFR